MPWVKVDDHFSNHPKVVAAGGDAAWLHVCALCYCAEHLTDGVVAKEIVGRLSDRKRPMVLAARLVEVGMWVDEGDSYRLHDFLEYNPSREHVENERRAARERRQRGGRTSRDVRANDMNPVPVPEVLTEPSGAPNGAASPAERRKRGTRIPDTFTVGAEDRAWVERECPDVDWRAQTRIFVDYWKAEGKAKVDWGRTWHVWMRREQAKTKNRGPTRTYL